MATPPSFCYPSFFPFMPNVSCTTMTRMPKTADSCESRFCAVQLPPLACDLRFARSERGDVRRQMNEL